MHGVWGLLAVLCLPVLLAGSARAGAFDSPMNANACATIDVAGAAMVLPNGAFTGAATVKQCRGLCAKGAKLCRAGVKDAASCYVGVYKNYKTFGKLNCDLVHADDAAARKVCKEGVNQVYLGILAKIDAGREGSLGDCDDWGDTCTSTCNVPM